MTGVEGERTMMRNKSGEVGGWDPEASEAALQDFCTKLESNGEPLKSLQQAGVGG